MISLFNLKENMMKIRGNTVEKDMSKEGQYKIVQEKIKRVKIEISNKLQKLKTNLKSKKSKPNPSSGGDTLKARRMNRIPPRLVLT